MGTLVAPLDLSDFAELRIRRGEMDRLDPSQNKENFMRPAKQECVIDGTTEWTVQNSHTTEQSAACGLSTRKKRL